MSAKRSLWILIGMGAMMTACTAGLRAGEDSLEKKLDQLNNVTGEEVMKAEKQALAGSKQAKKLIALAQKRLKKDSKALTYNGALLLAELARDAGNMKASEQFYRVCTALAKELESSTKLLEAYGGLILLFYQNKEYQQSARVCREVLELQTGPGKPRTVIVYFQTGPGDLTPVPLDSFDSAKRLQPGVERLLIQSVAKQGNYDEALKLADQQITDKSHWLQREIRAWVLREAGRSKEAAEEYQKILGMVQNDSTMPKEDRDDYEDQYRYVLSNVYVDMKKIDKAADQLKALIAKYPNDPSYYNDLGFIWADHDTNLKQAEEYIRKAIELDRAERKKQPNLSPAEDRDNGAYLDSLGWVLYRQKKYEEAKKWLLEAVKDERSQHIEIYDHLGDVHMALGDTEKAIAAWKKGVGLAGTSRREQELKTRVLRKLREHSK